MAWPLLSALCFLPTKRIISAHYYYIYKWKLNTEVLWIVIHTWIGSAIKFSLFRTSTPAGNCRWASSWHCVFTFGFGDSRESAERAFLILSSRTWSICLPDYDTYFCFSLEFLQGSSKHFITHSAITCSVQTDDIVACILLLYNPVTKCPLHVHAYRCDSESTAQALNQQLQVLINRPENQKRFAELETR